MIQYIINTKSNTINFTKMIFLIPSRRVFIQNQSRVSYKKREAQRPLYILSLRTETAIRLGLADIALPKLAREEPIEGSSYAAKIQTFSHFASLF